MLVSPPISISLVEISAASTAHSTGPQLLAAGPTFPLGWNINISVRNKRERPQATKDGLSNNKAAQDAQKALSLAARSPNAFARPAARETKSLVFFFIYVQVELVCSSSDSAADEKRLAGRDPGAPPHTDDDSPVHPLPPPAIASHPPQPGARAHASAAHAVQHVRAEPRGGRRRGGSSGNGARWGCWAVPGVPSVIMAAVAMPLVPLL